MKDGGASDKGLIPYEIIDVIVDSPSHVMSKIESVYKSGGSTTYTERFPVQDIGLLYGTSAKVSMMSYDPLIGETLSPELSRIPNVMGLFKESVMTLLISRRTQSCWHVRWKFSSVPCSLWSGMFLS